MSDLSARGPQSEAREARCESCGESFELSSGQLAGGEPDLMHFQRLDGQLCGGEGIPFRKFIIRKTNRV
jgi:hypothetical protein